MSKVAYEEERWHCDICCMECPEWAVDKTFPASL